MTIDLQEARRRAVFRRRRKELGIRQEDVAERAGTSKSTVSRYESGDTAPDPDTVARLLAAVELTPDELERALANSPAAPVATAEPYTTPLDMQTRTATPDQIADYLHAIVTTIRFSRPDQLPELARLMRTAHESLIVNRPPCPPPNGGA